EVTCDFFYQSASLIEPNVRYMDAPRVRYHAECTVPGPCNPDLSELRRVGAFACTNGGNPVLIGYTLNLPLSGYNVLFEQP
ncbi:hypothetical protein KJ969_01870, partial [Patescibacteria group bacterium]|nr:hypothetical protein [Patescibacteria group bacterium]